MTRNIKFRCFGKSGIMKNWDDVQPLQITPVLSTQYLVRFLCCDELNLMQYTGVKDKNGVEIYEGDIVVCPGVIVDEGAVIQWEEKDLCWSVGPGWPWCEFDYKDELEVIGNIYENPEACKE